MLTLLRERLGQIPLAAFRPRLVDALRDYDRARFLKDFAAGVTVGIVALPLAMAFGIASALYRRAQTGRGGEVDVALLMAALVLQNNGMVRVEKVDKPVQQGLRSSPGSGAPARRMPSRPRSRPRSARPRCSASTTALTRRRTPPSRWPA